MMKKIVLLALLVITTLTVAAQNAAQAKSVLDKTAAIVTAKSGASARFTLSAAGTGTVSGTIDLKGNKFHAVAGNAIVWFNGKTQWSYLKSTDEVNVSTPTEAQRMRMNPYTFITMYKAGYTLSMTASGANYNVHMVAQNKQRSVQEVYLTINKKTYKPTVIKMREGTKWTTITISNLKAQKLPDSVFSFRAKDFPTAEVIDLR